MARKFEIPKELVPKNIDLVKIREKLKEATGLTLGFDLTRDENDDIKALRVHLGDGRKLKTLVAALRNLDVADIVEEPYEPPSIKELDERIKALETQLGMGK